ncbi:unnamed protein product [Leptosia nina]|uniref:Uncharacterized protein n=1 Tax=Leptosia nina TaxID=320188 RepID=A0AAV1JLQ4_9NEOP
MLDKELLHKTWLQACTVRRAVGLCDSGSDERQRAETTPRSRPPSRRTPRTPHSPTCPPHPIRISPLFIFTSTPVAEFAWVSLF